ncbi:MAG: ATP-binding protein [Candidatus Omnitrophota bacterium]
MSPTYAHEVSGQHLSPQSTFSPLTNAEIKNLAMLEYVMVTGINSKKINPMEENKDRSALSLGVDFTDDLDEVDINFEFHSAVDYEKGGIRLVPCTLKTSAKDAATQYWCYIGPSVENTLPYTIRFFTRSEVKQKDLMDRLIELKRAERAERFAIRSAIESEKKHDEKIRRAIRNKKFQVVNEGNYKLVLEYVYAFLDSVSPTLLKDFKELVEAGQLIIITERHVEYSLKEPHAGAKGIYLPFDKRFINGGTIIHEVFAKAGFTHEKCTVFERIFEKFCRHNAGRKTNNFIKLPDKMLLGEEKLYYDEVVIAKPKFIDLAEAITRRDYSEEQNEEKNPGDSGDPSFSNKEVQNFADNMPVGIHKITPDGIITHVNQYELKLLGYSQEEMIGKSIFDFIVLEQREKAEKRLEAKLRGGGSQKTEDRWYVRKDGTKIIGATNDIVIRDKDGNPVEIITAFRDITESRMQENRIRTILEELPAVVIYKEFDGKAMRTRYANTRFYELHGLDSERHSVEGLTDFEIYEKFGLGPSYKWEKYADDDMRVYRGEVTIYTQEAMGYDKTIFVKVSKKRVGNGVLCIFADITELKMAEQVLEKKRNELELELEERAKELKQHVKMAAIGEMASKIAHDIRNPLTAVIASVTAAKNEIEEGQDITNVSKFLDLAKHAAQLVDDFVEKLLDFSRLGLRKIKLSPVSLGEVLGGEGGSVESCANIIERFKITLSTHGLDQEAGVLADRTELIRVFMNLITNACRAMGGEEVRSLDITLSVDREKGLASVSVTDTGKGIDPENMEKIFDPLFTTKMSGEGTGWGLATVRGIVKEHNGTIEVESTPGEGATFKITIPLVREQPAIKEVTRVIKPSDLPKAKTAGKIETVLVVDDSNDLTVLWKFLLKKLNIEAVTAGDKDEALRLMEKRSFDAIITDIKMKSAEEGFELAVEARSRGFTGPIAVFTGFGEDAPGVKRLRDEGIVSRVIEKTGKVLQNADHIKSIIDELEDIKGVPPEKDVIDNYMAAIKSKRKSIFDEEFVVHESAFRHDLMTPSTTVIGFISVFKESQELEKELIENLTDMSQKLSVFVAKVREFSDKITGSREEAVNFISGVIRVYSEMLDVLRNISEESKVVKAQLEDQPMKDAIEKIETIEKAASAAIGMVEEFLHRSEQRLKLLERKKEVRGRTIREVKTVLVVDDEESFRKVWEIVLGERKDKYGIEIITAGSMDEAMRIIDEKGVSSFDAIVADLDMEKGEHEAGFKIAVKARSKKFKGPIAIFTGHREEEARIELRVKRLHDEGIISIFKTKGWMSSKNETIVEEIINELRNVEIPDPDEGAVKTYEKAIDSKRESIFDEEEAEGERRAKELLEKSEEEFRKKREGEARKEAASKGALPKPEKSVDIRIIIQEGRLSELSEKTKASELQIASAEKVALIYGSNYAEGMKKLKAVGFNGCIVFAKDKDELKGLLASGEHFDVIINTTNENLEELIKKILSGLDSPPVVDDIDDTHHLQDTLLTICA